MIENETEIHGRDRSSGRWKLWATLPLLLLAIALAATNNHFNILDDEVVILETAHTPVLETLKLFLTGVGQHEHPPLSDLLVHLWIKIVPGSVFWLRLPFILCYVAAYGILVLLARRMTGRATAVALAWIALLSPYGFHFGRLLGWFNLMLLLVAALSYCFVRWLDTESHGWLAGTMAAATALIYTNYFGWVLAGLLALDAALFRKQRRWRAWVESAGALLLLAVLFAPLWSLFLHLSQHPDVRVQGSKLAAYIFDMYALLVSESFAPWFFAVGIPVALLCALCYVLTLAGTKGLARRFYIYFLMLAAVLAAAGLSNTKRLPFLLGWLFLPMAAAITRSDTPRLRKVLAWSLGILFAVGWFGTFAERYYASTHFIDDWRDAVVLGIEEHKAGGVLVYDDPVAEYYLGRACAPSSARYQTLNDHPACGMLSAKNWVANPNTGGRVVALRGVQYGLKEDPGDVYLDQNCRLERDQHYTRDTAAAIKRRLFPMQREPEWRVAVEVYQCP
jgi:hypothetical protein